MKNQKPYVLWLCSWYPHRTEPLDGDFVQRHAKATALYEDVRVVHIVRDRGNENTCDVSVKKNDKGSLSEIIIYYSSPRYKWSVIDKFFSYLKYREVFRKCINEYLDREGTPFLVHVHTGMKAGIMALWLKRKWNIPYVVTEHWAGFLPEADARFTDLPFYIRWPWSRVIKGASAVSAVSAYLATHLQRVFGKSIHVTVIPNVVDTGIFYSQLKETEKTTEFIHVSRLDYQKNPEAILQACSMAKAKGVLFHMTIFGPVKEELKRMREALSLTDIVSFHQEVSQPELASYIRKADGLILYSRFETFGCVLIEANASGVPVIASDIPVVHEIVAHGENGVIVKSEDPQSLADAIVEFIHQKDKFSRETIAANAASRYNYNITGEKFSEWYSQVINNK